MFFFIVAACMLAAFYLGTKISGLVIDKVSPYLFFGFKAVEAQQIKVVQNHRGLIEFSNGIAFRGAKLLPFDIIWVIISLTLIFCLWILLLKIATLLLIRVKPKIADEIGAFWNGFKK